MLETKQKLLIVDANALVHRAFHALPPTMITKDGIPTNAIYGFVSILSKALKEIKPDYVAICFDVSKKTFRTEMYAEYKANRVKQADELYMQFPYIKEIVKDLNFNIFEKEGFEADDLIGTICKKNNLENIENIILTGDKDTFQLVNDNTKIYTFKTGISELCIYDRQGVKVKMGVTPEQVIDYKALRGDPSDNIPGVKGIGEKTAVELLEKYNNLENIYKNIEEEKIDGITPRNLNLLKEQKDIAFLSYKLSTIKTDVDIDFDLEKCKIQKFDLEEIKELFIKLEFKNLLDRILDLEKELNLATSENIQESTSLKLEKVKYTFLKTEKEIEEFLNKLESQKEFAFDLKINEINSNKNILGISFSSVSNEAYYIAFSDIAAKNFFKEKLKNIFENKEIKKIGHNLKKSAHILEKENLKLNGIYFDTMVAAYVLFPGERKYNLDNLAFLEFGYRMQKQEKDSSENKKVQSSFSFENQDEISVYCCENVDMIFRLYIHYLEEFKNNEKLKNILFNIENKLIPVLIEMENYGIMIDKNYIESISKEYSEKIKEIENKVFAVTGEFNLNSPKQLQDVLFNKLSINTKGVKKTKTGISTNSDELEKLKDTIEDDEKINLEEKNKIVDLLKNIIQYREYEKLKNTYIDVLPEIADKETNKIHTNYNQTITATGRLSSSEPNLQNIPVRSEDGKKIRKAFVASSGYKLVSLDYSQVELRIAASVTNQISMIESFKNNFDIHKATAAFINNIDINKVTSEQRSAAKSVNFGILYGMGPRKLSKDTGISFKEAKEYIQKYFEINTEFKKYIDNTIDFARKNEYVENIFGRRRYFRDINSSSPMVRATAERMAINMPIQGAAADIMKIAMIKVYDKINEKYGSCNENVKILLQVHDELVFEIKDSELETTIPILKNEMEKCFSLPNVDLKVSIEVGNNWGEMEEVNY